MQTALDQFRAGRYENISVDMFCKLAEHIDISDYVRQVRPSDYLDTIQLLPEIAIQQWRIALTYHRLEKYKHTVWIDFCNIDPKYYIRSVKAYRCIKFRCNPGLKQSLYISLLKDYTGPFFDPECRCDDQVMEQILSIRPDFFPQLLKNGLSPTYYLELCHRYKSIGTRGIPYKFNLLIPTELQLLILQYSPELYQNSNSMIVYSPQVTLRYLKSYPPNFATVVAMPLFRYQEEPLDIHSCIRMLQNQILQKRFFMHPNTRVSIPDLIEAHHELIDLTNIADYTDAISDTIFLKIVRRCKYIPGRCDKYIQRIPPTLVAELVTSNTIKKISNLGLLECVVDFRSELIPHLTKPQRNLIF